MRSPTSSRTSSTSSVTPQSRDLSYTARTILTALYSEQDMAAVTSHISPQVIVQNGDNPPMLSSREQYFDDWSRKFQSMPNIQIEIKEACVDESQRKVWVRSEITGLPNGIRKESIDMMSFDEEGLLSGSIGHKRVIRKRDDEDDY